MLDLNMREPRLTMVPDQYLRYTCGKMSMDDFTLAGREIFTMLNLAAQHYGNKPISSFDHILDFGCGVGRILQFIPNGPSISACDVNEELVEYVRTQFPEIDVYKNQFTPPLKYPSDLFDFIYSFSVFSHLGEEVENTWLEELRRVGKPGCVYLVTIQGEWMIEATLGDERRNAERAGFYYRKVHQRHNSPMDFPDGYESSYHTNSYILDVWSKHFDVLAVVKGNSPRNYLWGEHSFQPDGRIPPFRPMGQCLVVMRKPASR